MKLIEKTSKAYKGWKADFDQLYNTDLSCLDWDSEDVQLAGDKADELGFHTDFKKSRKNGKRIVVRLFNRFNETQGLILCSR